MIWDEPLGLERWKSLSQDLISYLSSVCGKRGDSHSLFVAESLYQHMLRVIDNCSESAAAQLNRDVTPYTSPIDVAMDLEEAIDTDMYMKSFNGFMTYLQRWLTKHSYVLTFGKAKASSTPTPRPANPPKQTPTPQTLHPTPLPNPPPAAPPSYSDVVTAGGAGNPQLRAMDTRQAQARQFTQAQNQSSWKKTQEELQPPPPGITRTWGYMQKTAQGSPYGRVHCRDPPPADNKDPACHYLGDYLDAKGQCTYCTKTTHKKVDCVDYHKMVARWKEEEAKRLAANSPTAGSSQENPTAKA
jgi:hypothetical protein